MSHQTKVPLGEAQNWHRPWNAELRLAPSAHTSEDSAPRGHGPAVWEAAPCARRALTVLKDPLHVQAIRGTRLVVCAPLQVAGELPSPGVVDDPRVGGTDGVWNRQMHRRHGDHMRLQFLPQPKITE